MVSFRLLLCFQNILKENFDIITAHSFDDDLKDNNCEAVITEIYLKMKILDEVKMKILDEV